jgi:hypothetical protein
MFVEQFTLEAIRKGVVCAMNIGVRCVPMELKALVAHKKLKSKKTKCTAPRLTNLLA